MVRPLTGFDDPHDGMTGPGRPARDVAVPAEGRPAFEEAGFLATQVATSLTADLMDRLCGRVLEEVARKAIPVVTVDERGWPHPALLSYFEVVAVGPTSLRLAVYGTSTTARNLRRDGRLTLAVVDDGAAYYVKGAASELAPRMRTAPEHASFEVHVETVLADVADASAEPYAWVTGGITYATRDPAASLERARRILGELTGRG